MGKSLNEVLMGVVKPQLTEVAEPTAGDEIAFKKKHEVELKDDPNAEEEQFTGGTEKDLSRKADYQDGEDEEVYEDVAVGQAERKANMHLLSTGYTHRGDTRLGHKRYLSHYSHEAERWHHLSCRH